MHIQHRNERHAGRQIVDVIPRRPRYVAVVVDQIDPLTSDRREIATLLRRASAKREPHRRYVDAFRLVHGTCDGLDGYLIDKFGDSIAIKQKVPDADRLEAVCEALREQFNPRAIATCHDWFDKKSSAGAPDTRFHQGKVLRSICLADMAAAPDPCGSLWQELQVRQLKPSRVLEVGSQSGGLALQLADMGCTVTVVERFVGEAATLRFDMKVNDLAASIEIVELSSLEPLLRAESFDLVVLHCDLGKSEDISLFRELPRACVADGHFILVAGGVGRLQTLGDGFEDPPQLEFERIIQPGHDHPDVERDELPAHMTFHDVPSAAGPLFRLYRRKAG